MSQVVIAGMIPPASGGGIWWAYLYNQISGRIVWVPLVVGRALYYTAKLGWRSFASAAHPETPLAVDPTAQPTGGQGEDLERVFITYPMTSLSTGGGPPVVQQSLVIQLSGVAGQEGISLGQMDFTGAVTPLRHYDFGDLV